MLKLDRPFVILDLETTGVNPATDRIVQFAALKVHPGGTRTPWSILLNPGIPIPAEATAVHSITDKDVEGLPTFSSWSERIARAIKNCDLGGFNLLNFDIPLLWEEFYRAGYTWDLTGIKILDVRNLWTQMEPRTLTGAVQYFLGREHTGAHSATEDVEATGDVLHEQIRRWKLDPSLDKLIERAALDDRRYADVARKLYFGPDDAIRFNFGKHKDKDIMSERGYANWMLDHDFPESTKLALRGGLGKEG